MREKIGNIIYCAACIMSAFFMYNYMPSIRGAIPPSGDKMLFALGGTTIFWFIGWLIRYILSGNTSTRI
jgi:hypothetical protein